MEGLSPFVASEDTEAAHLQKSKTVRTQTSGTTRLIFIVSQLSAAVLYAQLYDTGFSVCFYKFLSDNGLGEPLV